MNIINRGYYSRVALIFCARAMCVYYSRAATIRINTVYTYLHANVFCNSRLYFRAHQITSFKLVPGDRKEHLMITYVGRERRV